MINRGIEDGWPTKVDVPLQKEKRKKERKKEKRIQTKSNKNIVKKVM